MRDDHWYKVSKKVTEKIARTVAEMDQLSSAFRTIGNARIAGQINSWSATLSASINILDLVMTDALADELKPTETKTSPDGRYEWGEPKPKPVVVTFK